MASGDRCGRNSNDGEESYQGGANDWERGNTTMETKATKRHHPTMGKGLGCPEGDEARG